MSEALSQELLDRAAIKELKARYFRLVDAKDWQAWREVFTDDVHVRLPDLEPFVGASAPIPGWRSWRRAWPRRSRRITATCPS